MNKKEIAEIKKQYTLDRCPATRICGCYVDAEKRKQTEFCEAFLSLPEEEFYKYLNIFRKAMSGTMGRNLLDMEFPLETEEEGGTQELLMKLKVTGLQDDGILEEFYDKIIDSFYYVGNYLILLIHGTYDIPGRASDHTEMFDASDEIYEHLICCVCPVNLTKPCLSYNGVAQRFENRMQDWVVDMPMMGFLFPAFNDRSADIHSLLYYVQKPEIQAGDFVDAILGCRLPMTVKSQQETFETLVEDALGEECDFEMVRTLHENLNEILEEQKEKPEIVKLDKGDVKRLFEVCGASDEKLEQFDECFDKTAGEADVEFVAANVAHTRKFEVKTPDIVIQVNPEKTELIRTQEIDGRKCLVIELDETVQVNGINVKA